MLEHEQPADQETNTIYLDIPTLKGIDSADASWTAIKQFASQVEAVEFIREHIGPCDDRGRIDLLSNLPPEPERTINDATKRLIVNYDRVIEERDAFFDACEQFFDATDEDEKHHAKVAMEKAIALASGESSPVPLDADNKCITIAICGGMLIDVMGLPEGWTHRLVNHDVEEFDDVDIEDDEDE